MPTETIKCPVQRVTNGPFFHFFRLRPGMPADVIGLPRKTHHLMLPPPSKKKWRRQTKENGGELAENCSKKRSPSGRCATQKWQSK